jgi:hypothetical protein
MSDVWEFFQKIINDNNIIISINCQLCESEYGTATSTTILHRHLTSVHNTEYHQQEKQQEQCPSYSSDEQSHITANLIEWIIVDLQPFNVVEQAEFQQFIHSLDSRYVIPCRQTVKEEINTLFTRKKLNIKLEINNLTTKVALTTDIWSSNYNNTAYLGVTMHYINND